MSTNEVFLTKITPFFQTIGLKVQNLDLYFLAFVHRSFVNEKPDVSKEHNERLEFLGDAVLELIVTTKLYHDFPHLPEGDLTNYRSLIVKGSHLAQVARNFGFQEFLILGKGEELGGGRDKDYLLANCVEAFLGALYLDLGYEVVQKFVLQYVYTDIHHILKQDILKDYKSLFQEFAQEYFSITPEYRVLSESGLDHDKNYVSGVYLRDTLVGEGAGSSKKKSQESAAQNAYEHKESLSKKTIF